MQSLGPFDGITQPAVQVDGAARREHRPHRVQLDGSDVHRAERRGRAASTSPCSRTPSKYQNYVTFVVRDDASQAPFLYQQPVANYQAYNNWPNYGGGDARNGKSLYDNKSGGAETVAGSAVSAPSRCRSTGRTRTTAHRELTDENGWSWELYFVRWIEQNGYDVTYSTSVDTHEHGARLLDHTAFVSVGHDEYWSKQMFDAAEAARDAGVNLAFFGGNDVYWQVRFEPSGSGAPTGSWSATRTARTTRSRPSIRSGIQRSRRCGVQDPPVNRPAQTLLGSTFSGSTERSNRNSAYIVSNAGHWIYAGTGLADGSTIPGIVGYEADGYNCHYPAPASSSYTVVGDSPFTDGDGYTEPSTATIYRAPSGAWVFYAATVAWSWALDRSRPAPDEGLPNGWVDPRIQQTTKNILDGFGGQTAAGAARVGPARLPRREDDDLRGRVLHGFLRRGQGARPAHDRDRGADRRRGVGAPRERRERVPRRAVPRRRRPRSLVLAAAGRAARGGRSDRAGVEPHHDRREPRGAIDRRPLPPQRQRLDRRNGRHRMHDDPARRRHDLSRPAAPGPRHRRRRHPRGVRRDRERALRRAVQVDRRGLLDDARRPPERRNDDRGGTQRRDRRRRDRRQAADDAGRPDRADRDGLVGRDGDRPLVDRRRDERVELRRRAKRRRNLRGRYDRDASGGHDELHRQLGRGRDLLLLPRQGDQRRRDVRLHHGVRQLCLQQRASRQPPAMRPRLRRRVWWRRSCRSRRHGSRGPTTQATRAATSSNARPRRRSRP